MHYSLKSEYIIDIDEPEVQKTFVECQLLFDNFVENYLQAFDLEKEDSIAYVYEKAKEKGVFDLAKYVRRLIFGNNIYFYGVSYLWDDCINDCIYCPASIRNKTKSKYRNKLLSIEKAIEETLLIMREGNTHICYLTGENIKKYPPKFLAKYLLEIDKVGLNEIILNIAPLTEDGFKILRNSVQNTSLQFRVFQETYDRKIYNKVHPNGPKSNYDFRLSSQARALKAGFDNVGIGALFGLQRFPLCEILGLRQHACFLRKTYNVDPIRVALPSAHFLQNIDVQIPYVLKGGLYHESGELIQASYYELFDELIYALAKLAMPHLSLISSERDCAGLLKIIDNYATCTTINVHPKVGRNITRYKNNKNRKTKEIYFEQTTSFARDVKETLLDMKKRGWNPVFI